MPKKLIVRLELNGSAKQLLDDLSKRHVMNKSIMLARLIEFLIEQDEALVSIMMAGYPPDVQREAAKVALANMK